MKSEARKSNNGQMNSTIASQIGRKTRCSVDIGNGWFGLSFARAFRSTDAMNKTRLQQQLSDSLLASLGMVAESQVGAAVNRSNDFAQGQSECRGSERYRLGPNRRVNRLPASDEPGRYKPSSLTDRLRLPPAPAPLWTSLLRVL